MKVINATRDFTERDRVEFRYRKLMDAYELRKQGIKTNKDNTPKQMVIAGIIFFIIVTIIILNK